MGKEASKKVRSSKSQIRMLVDYMSTHKNFANGEFSGPLGTQQYQAQWERLSTSLSEHGPQKSSEQWRTTWRDLKRRAREEGANFKKASAATGNNVLIPTISEISQKVLAIIGKEMAFGITNSQESGIGTFLTDTSANACSSNAFIDVNNTLESLSPVLPPPTSLTRSVYLPPPPAAPQRRVGLGERAASIDENNALESLSPVPPPPARLTRPVSLPPPAAAPQRRVGLGEHAASIDENNTLESLSPVPPPPAHLTRPVSLPPPTAAPQRRVGLGERAAEFLAAEEATTGVLKDILNTLQSQNRIKRRQWIREERIRCARR